MEINGVPLHGLVVHAAVVFAPLASLVALVYAAWPRWRDRLRLPTLAVAAAAVASVAGAFLSGDNLLETQRELDSRPYVELHAERADLLLWLTLAFGAVTVLGAWLHGRPGPLRTAVRVLLGVLALAVLVQTVLVGDAGARAVWQDV